MDDQLRPFRVPPSNAVLKGPEGTDVGDLDCELVRDTEEGFVVTISRWDLDQDLRAKLSAGAHIRLSVWQHPIPPLAVAVEHPFHCGEEMIWRDGQFVCGDCGEAICAGEHYSAELKLGDDDDADGDDSRRAAKELRRDFRPGESI
jgi:hypothetical protein